MIDAPDLLVIGVVAGLFAAVFAVAEIWWRLAAPPVEYTRKFLHVCCGLIALPLVWLVPDPWLMLLLGVGFMAVVAFTKRVGLLPCLHDVARCSDGAALYPLSVFVTYLIATSTGHPEFYVVAIAVLALADTAASLVGMSYGRHLFLVEDDRKSIEGSAAFFLCTFTIVHICLSLLTNLGAAECILCALYVSWLITCVELLSLSGADNLFVPVGVIAILLKITSKDLPEMTWQVGLMALDFAIVALLLRPRRNLSASAVVGLGLLTYGTHALVGLSWAYVLFLAIAIYGVSGVFGFRASGTYRIRFVFSATLVVSVCVLVTNYLGFPHHVAFLPFAIAAVGTLHLALEHMSEWTRSRRTAAALLLAACFGVWHQLFDANGVWWFDVSVLFAGDLLLVTFAGMALAGPGSLISKTRRAAFAGGALSLVFLIVSWGFHAYLI